MRKWEYYRVNFGHKKYVEVISKVVDWLIKEKNVMVIFASTCTNFYGYHHDDRLVAYEVIDLLKGIDCNRVKVLTGEYTPQQLVSFYSHVDLHIGTRMHSNILAVLAGTPIVAIGYEFKTEGLLSQLGLDDFVVDIESLSFDELQKIIEKVLDGKEVFKKKIKARVADLKNLARQTPYIIRDYLNKSNI